MLQIGPTPCPCRMYNQGVPGLAHPPDSRAGREELCLPRDELPLLHCNDATASVRVRPSNLPLTGWLLNPTQAKQQAHAAAGAAAARLGRLGALQIRSFGSNCSWPRSRRQQPARQAPAATAAQAAAAAHKAPRGANVRQMSEEQQAAWHAGWELPGHHSAPQGGRQAQQAQQAQQQQQQQQQQQPGESGRGDAAVDSDWLQRAQWDGEEEEEGGNQPVQRQEGRHPLDQPRGHTYQPVAAAGKRERGSIWQLWGTSCADGS